MTFLCEWCSPALFEGLVIAQGRTYAIRYFPAIFALSDSPTGPYVRLEATYPPSFNDATHGMGYRGFTRASLL